MTARELSVLRDRVRRAQLAIEERKLPAAPAIPAGEGGGIRYETREQALAARRRSWVESKRRHATGVTVTYRPCGHCATEFLPSKHVSPAVAAYCSSRCRSRAYYWRNRDRITAYKREWMRERRAAA